MAVFETHLTLQTTPEQLFDFLARPEHAVELAPPGTSLELLSAPDVLQTGSRIEFDVHGYGPVHRIVEEITELQRPEKITAAQIRGPFKTFVHQTLLKPAGNGQVELTDRIEFEPPGGLLGFLLTEDRIRRMLEEGYQHRHEELQAIFSPSEPSQS